MSKFGFFIAAASLVAVSAATASTSTALMAGFGWDGTSVAASGTTIIAASASGFGWD